MTRRKFEASFRYAPFGFKFLPTVHSFWVFFDCTFLDNSSITKSNGLKSVQSLRSRFALLLVPNFRPQNSIRIDVIPNSTKNFLRTYRSEGILQYQIR